MSAKPVHFAGAGSAIPTFSPTKIALFRKCPEQYVRKYHRLGPRRREPATRALARGTAVHALMQNHARRRENGWQPTDAIVTQALEEAGFPADERDAFDEDAEAVLQLVTWGIAEFEERFGGARVVATEEFLSYTHGRAGIPAYRLEARIDLVALHPDGTLEHVDYKTGKLELDPTQNLICRIVTGRNATALAAGDHVLGNEAIRTSVMFLAERQTVSRVIPRDELLSAWEDLQETIDKIMTGMDRLALGAAPWLPTPNGLCAYCPFNADCTRNTVSAADTSMLGWLTGAGPFA